MSCQLSHCLNGIEYVFLYECLLDELLAVGFFHDRTVLAGQRGIRHTLVGTFWSALTDSPSHFSGPGWSPWLLSHPPLLSVYRFLVKPFRGVLPQRILP